MSKKKVEKLIIEHAKSGRASCRTCRKRLEKDEVRVGIPFTFTRPNGEEISSFRYYHVICVPYDRIKSVLEVFPSLSIIDKEKKEKLFESLKKREKDEMGKLQEKKSELKKPFLEPSKSSRGSCRICEKKIEKGILRVAEPSQIELDDGRKFFSHKYFHMTCYIESSRDRPLLLKDLIETSLAQGSISQEEAEKLDKDLQADSEADEKAASVLAVISDEPIDIMTLEKLAKEKGVPFNHVKKALEKGLLQGVFFESSPGMIQKL
ncbi:MAG: hypothetical protein ACFFB2_03235 [Promethearchaeota archaeon]